MAEERNKSVKESDVKLPKLTVTKLQGTHLDWLQFWSQFETEVDKATITQVANFSYPKELLVPKVRSAVDGLPYNTEGYERAKAILTAKYRKPSEVANAHIQSIIALPTVQGSQPARVHDFYEKLATNVQVLDTMRKIKEINGYVRVTLDKLPGIRADLLCLDDNWHDWAFPQIMEALRKWCERNPLHSSDQSNKSRARFFNSRQEDYRDHAFTALQPATSLLTVTR